MRGRDALLESVKNYFISLFTDRAILYRIQNGFDHRMVALSVVVQKMIQSELSGILFTADPVAGNRNVTSINAGEILVAPLTDPGWTPLFINAVGLINEVGGVMSHGSLVAREYGILAVVGVIDATKKIKTGQRIRVHGDSGYVEIL